jgi:hypothetical protein
MQFSRNNHSIPPKCGWKPHALMNRQASPFNTDALQIAGIPAASYGQMRGAGFSLWGLILASANPTG